MSRDRGAGRGDRGTAVLEFMALGVGLLVPLAYVATAAASVQSAAFASAEAVREAGRAFAASATPTEASRRAQAAAVLAFADHGLALPPGALSIRCTQGPCLAPGSVVDVAVTWSVPLPWVPAAASVGAPAIPIEARQIVPVDDFRDDA